VHRAITLIVMMLIAVGLIVMLTAGAIASMDAHSLIALAVVVAAAAVSGVAFSWNRYFKKPAEKRRAN
jgi:drug/metabolite transporter (DMT)-like permease